MVNYHGCSDLNRYRDNSPAADTKTDYIISVLNRLGYSVDNISLAASSKSNYIQSYTDKRGNNTYHYFASLGTSKFIPRAINRFFMKLQFLFWCLLNIKRDEQIIVYHSLGYASFFLKLKRLKSIRIIGEIEEIYQDVCKPSKSRCDNEFRFIEKCDKYIFPTQLLDKKVNRNAKPSLIIHGVYKRELITENKFSDGKIHVVYGGTLDINKGGAAAAAAAEYLPNNYHIHICGFGSPEKIIALISDIKKRSKAMISFEGEIKGRDYNRFIQKCHIGLCTQNPHAAFNSTSFPSKVLMYLSNGLKVVSIRIPAVEQSAIANYLTFYDKQTPRDIANAILQANELKSPSNDFLTSLDNEFCSGINNLIGCSV